MTVDDDNAEEGIVRLPGLLCASRMYLRTRRVGSRYGMPESPKTELLPSNCSEGDLNEAAGAADAFACGEASSG